MVGGDSNLCSAVSYFSTRVGSIIGAGRLSFRVRDGSGRFPVAMDRRNFIVFSQCYLVVGCVLWVCGVVARFCCCCKFSAG